VYECICIASVFLSVLVSVSRDLKCIGVYIVLLKSSLIFVFLSASKRYNVHCLYVYRCPDWCRLWSKWVQSSPVHQSPLQFSDCI